MAYYVIFPGARQVAVDTLEAAIKLRGKDPFVYICGEDCDDDDGLTPDERAQIEDAT